MQPGIYLCNDGEKQTSPGYNYLGVTQPVLFGENAVDGRNAAPVDTVWGFLPSTVPSTLVLKSGQGAAFVR